MHVHVSPGTTPELRYQLPEVKQILKAISYYDEAVTKIVPADRKNNPYAESSFTGLASPAKLRQRFKDVPTLGWTPLFQLFDEQRSKQHVQLEVMTSQRYVSWNFGNLTTTCGTVEFRRQPGVKTAKEAKHRVGITLGFIRAALLTDWGRYKTLKRHGSVQQLRDFVRSGIRTLCNGCVDAVVDVALVEDTNPARVCFLVPNSGALRAKRRSRRTRKARSLQRSIRDRTRQSESRNKDFLLIKEHTYLRIPYVGSQNSSSPRLGPAWHEDICAC
ncbi:uncharacterized protein F5Z01DRAFT_687403 [Emericellopsis atlantica]|uniref:Uncharacterized protein n=1 Tax=Emericellopsis atlantica TaxID=2614577 RepID=A0A9P7ZL26_9HYPO|nr:uncharacterized protein F5Z01DRAFT_687403 [Emericellopsis atlantica]KAG9253975.1 hypothetical protein F5Z01DRAFT_687403 [Emericellopsis atlantica]